MKPSHTSTPRTLADASFIPSADPIERPETQRMDWQDRVVLTACILAAIACAAIITWSA